MPKSQRPRKGRTVQVRKHETYIEFVGIADEAGQIKFDIDPSGRITSPHARPESFSLITGYERQSGKKKIVYSHGGADSAFLAEKDHLLSQCTRLACIDTNTFQVGDLRVSATCLAINPAQLDFSKNEMNFDLKRFAFFDVPIDVNPEMVALDIALHYFIPQDADTLAKWRIIVDSELGKHEEINKRQEPYLDSKILRDDIKLAYASADSGQSLSNNLIKLCDAQAKSLMKGCQSHPEKLKAIDDAYPYCRGWMLFNVASDG
jgi:hypothetical protein